MMIKLLTMTVMAAAIAGAVPAQAGPGVVLQGPSATGIAIIAVRDGQGNSCPTWRCGFNGVSLNGWSLNGAEASGRVGNAVDASFAVTGVTLPGGEVLAID